MRRLSSFFTSNFEQKQRRGHTPAPPITNVDVSYLFFFFLADFFIAFFFAATLLTTFHPIRGRDDHLFSHDQYAI
jgi:hypothetical protein